MAVGIAPDEMAVLLSHAERCYPAECCGVLLGVRESEGVRVTGVVQTVNAHQTRPGTRFEIAPQDLLRAMRQSRDEGREIVGYYHSHPDHSATPSRLDEEAAWPEVSYLIVGVAGGKAREVRSWKKRGSQLVEEQLTGCSFGDEGEPPHG